jgi:parallel beta-helix repeat protein
MLDGIIISETSAHIVVARVELHGASLDRNGLYFYNVANVIVRDCRISGYLNGISAFGSSNLEFTNNTVTRNGYGIVLETSDSNKLIANRFDGNTEIGIFVRASSNLVKDNSATGNGFGGINVDGTAGPANENQLEGNIVSDNEVYGIGVWRGGHNVLKQNKVTHNKIVGIMLTDQSTNNTIEANIVSNNTGSGITLIDGSSGNTIRGNMARGNGDGINYFDLYDAVLGNIWQNNTYDTKKPESIG